MNQYSVSIDSFRTALNMLWYSIIRTDFYLQWKFPDIKRLPPLNTLGQVINTALQSLQTFALIAPNIFFFIYCLLSYSPAIAPKKTLKQGFCHWRLAGSLNTDQYTDSCDCIHVSQKLRWGVAFKTNFCFISRGQQSFQSLVLTDFQERLNLFYWNSITVFIIKTLEPMVMWWQQHLKRQRNDDNQQTKQKKGLAFHGSNPEDMAGTEQDKISFIYTHIQNDKYTILTCTHGILEWRSLTTATWSVLVWQLYVKVAHGWVNIWMSYCTLSKPTIAHGHVNKTGSVMMQRSDKITSYRCSFFFFLFFFSCVPR